MYFLTPRKCAIFGICCEAVPRQVSKLVRQKLISKHVLQVNYLIDEAVHTGKGANQIISLLHHFLETHSLGESELHLHADNCAGQNKNRFMVQYLCWRVLVGLNKKITLSFLIVGHTKFSPDWCFGLFKQAFRRAKIGCLDDIVKVVEASAAVNHAQLVGSQDGEVIVQVYDWANHFHAPFKQTALKGIKSMHHLTFTSEKPGIVSVQESSTSPAKEINMLKSTSWKPTRHQLPDTVTPAGLPPERQQYLFEKIREFCPAECQDAVCPEPSTIPPTPKRRRKK